MELKPNTWYWMITPSMSEWSTVYINCAMQLSIGEVFLSIKQIGKAEFKEIKRPKRNPFKNK